MGKDRRNVLKRRQPGCWRKRLEKQWLLGKDEFRQGVKKAWEGGKMTSRAWCGRGRKAKKTLQKKNQRENYQKGDIRGRERESTLEVSRLGVKKKKRRKWNPAVYQVGKLSDAYFTEIKVEKRKINVGGNVRKR